MEDKDKDFNLNFIPQVRLGEVLFSFNDEKEVIKVLGVPTERNIDFFNHDEYVVHLGYWKWNISISIYFERNTFNYLSISSQDIILGDFRFTLHNRTEILSFINEYHNVQKLNFNEKIEYDKDVDETCYTYESLGLSIWFDENGISDICVWKSKD